VQPEPRPRAEISAINGAMRAHMRTGGLVNSIYL
jgi:hypothetical protein